LIRIRIPRGHADPIPDPGDPNQCGSKSGSGTLLFILDSDFVFLSKLLLKTFFLLLLAVCRSQDGVEGVLDVGEESTAGSVPPAPVPGAVPATRPPASTGQSGPHSVIELILKLGHFKIIMIFRKIW
jgi:hypothetical protein